MNIYAFLIGVGASFGLACVAVQTAPARRSSALLDGGLISLAGALIGGRAGYVAQNWAHFQAFPAQIPQIWLGGFSGLGAMLGGMLGLLVAAGILRMSPGVLADGLAPMLPPLAVCAWLACWQAGTAYGAAAPGAWWAIPTRDETGLVLPRFPLQPLAAAFTVGLFTLIELIRRRLTASGQLAGLSLAGMAALLCAASFLRADPSPVWRSLRWDAWGSAALAGICLIGFAAASIPREHRREL
ncbi:MAG TPA: prolipoprotein diacylglyceryl transferase family protein [Anaerolineaceae bacterium]